MTDATNQPGGQAPSADEVLGIPMMEEPDAVQASQPEAAPVEVVRDPDPVVEDEGKPFQNAIVGLAVFSEETPGATEKLQLPSDLDSKVNDQLARMPSVNLLGTPEQRRWAAILSEGLNYNTDREVFVQTLANAMAEFTNKPEHNGHTLVGASPNYKAREGEKLSGDTALFRMASHLGHGTIFQAPMWHSGFWVTFKPPVDTDIVELNRQINADKITFGRASYGLMFSNMTVFTIDKLLEFARAHIYNLTTVPEAINKDNILEHLSSQDIPSFLWGFINTMYPRGFAYERGCISKPEECNHITAETLNVSKLQYTNMKPLTEFQRNHMANRQAKVKTLADVARYKSDLALTQTKRYIANEGLTDEIAFTLRSPSASAYIAAGYEWIDGIVASVDAALGHDANPTERMRTITLQGQSTALRQYGHWIESVQYNTNVTDDPETMAKMLSMLTSNPTTYDQFIDAVLKYIQETTLSVIGIPVFTCPKCGKDQETTKKYPHHTNVIPLDVVQVFFALVTQRLEKIAQR